MKVQTNPGWGDYDVSFIANIAQGGYSPLTFKIERNRRDEDVQRATLYIKVGDVQLVQAYIDCTEDAEALAELFTRARLYEFPPKKED